MCKSNGDVRATGLCGELDACSHLTGNCREPQEPFVPARGAVAADSIAHLMPIRVTLERVATVRNAWS